jgi:hypothetical protein
MLSRLVISQFVSIFAGRKSMKKKENGVNAEEKKNIYDSCDGSLVMGKRTRF